MGKVLLTGAYGQHNPGDDALLSAFVQALEGHEVVATSSDPASTTAMHGCEAVSSLEPAAILRALRHVDAVVVGGGTLFKPLHPTTSRASHELLRNATLLALAARAAKKPVLLLGVGAAPLETPRECRLARRLVRGSDLLVLRDEVSAEILAATGAPVPFRVGADATWPLLADQPLSVPRIEDVVLVVVCRFAGEREVAAALAEELRALRAAGLRIRLQPWQVGTAAPDDLSLTHSLACEIGGPVELVDPPADLHDAVRQAAASRLLVGMRFHALVSAAVAGTRMVAVDHEPKLGALAGKLGQQVVHPGVHTGGSGALMRALEGPPPDREVVLSQRALAGEGFRLLRLFLGGEDPGVADRSSRLPFVPQLERTA